MAEIYCPTCSRNIGDARFLEDGYVCPCCGYTDIVSAPLDDSTGSDSSSAPVESEPVAVDPGEVQS